MNHAFNNRTLVTQNLLTYQQKSDYVSSLVGIHLFALVEVTSTNYDDQRSVVTIFTDSSFVPPLIYAVMGSSRDIAIGPVAVVSLLLGTLLQNEIDPKTHPQEYSRLAFTATFFAGVTQAALGFFRSVPSDGSLFVCSSGLLARTVYVVRN